MSKKKESSMVRVPFLLREMYDRLPHRDTYSSWAEFVRSAVRKEILTQLKLAKELELDSE